MARLALVWCALTASSWALAGVGQQDLRRDLDAYAPAIAAHGTHELTFSQSELKKLAKGSVVKRRMHLDGADRVLGAIWTPESMDAVWIALQDPDHWSYVDGFREEHLPQSTHDKKLVHHHITFPWPFHDRQWVILVENNLKLIRHTDGLVWERTWDVDPRRGAKNEDPKAVWVDINEGGWWVVSAGGGTLLVYHLRTVIGGKVPDEIVTRWSMATLGGMLRGITERSSSMSAHYGSSHTPVKRPDGSVIPPMGE